ncbi:MAG: glutaconyl-CoA decarboxylase subunit alpha [Deltaproteobacteria bacterium]|nr:glutaconyl-CoA decarboxylase subunit alpha [Deltaproteobacteria bacterium]
MRPYFETMQALGKPLSLRQISGSADNARQIGEVEALLAAEEANVQAAGLPEAVVNERGQLTVWQRVEFLVDPGTWSPLHSLYNPKDNPYGTTGVVDGLGRISGRWAVIIGFDNKVLAGAWVAGQAENILRVTDLAKRLNIPLVWLVNGSGVDLPNQELVYPDRRGNGATFFRHAELQQRGVPILAAIYGTNPAGGGHQAISPTVLFAHKDANMAVGGWGIASGMSPKGSFGEEGCEALIEATRRFQEVRPGGVEIHRDATGFFRHVYDTEQEVLSGVREYLREVPSYPPRFFRVTEPRPPRYPPEELDRIVPFSPKRTYPVEEVVARLVDGSEHLEFRPGYGPEVYCGLAVVDGFPVALVANRQGPLRPGYPEDADAPGIGGKLYRQGLVKMNEFVTLCGRDRLPIAWIQDTTGLDVGDAAERAELLGLGQALVYSIQQTDVPMLCVVLRKGSVAGHYVMGGPQANGHNALTLGTPVTEICVLPGETAAAAHYARQLVKERDAGRSIAPVMERMTALKDKIERNSRPLRCAQKGYVDQVVGLPRLRDYLVAFAGAAYQNPRSFCPAHQMILPRAIRG